MPYNKEEPNHTCQNRRCHKGENGGPARYYACDDCLHKGNRPSFWKEWTCSLECFQQWMQDMEASGLNPEYTKYIADEAKKHSITITAAKPVAVRQTTTVTKSVNQKKHR